MIVELRRPGPEDPGPLRRRVERAHRHSNRHQHWHHHLRRSPGHTLARAHAVRPGLDRQANMAHAWHRDVYELAGARRRHRLRAFVEA